jgi:hypothetical protein
MNSMPACSLKGLLTHIHTGCTKHPSSHGKAFNQAETVEARGIEAPDATPWPLEQANDEG